MRTSRYSWRIVGAGFALGLAACSPSGDQGETPPLMVELPPPAPETAAAPAGPETQPPGDFISEEEMLGTGEAMAENLCQGCHAIGTTGNSPHPSAPNFRDLSQQLELESLRAQLLSGIVVNHPDMPEWQFEPRHVDSLLFYLDSIQATNE